MWHIRVDLANDSTVLLEVTLFLLKHTAVATTTMTGHQGCSGYHTSFGWQAAPQACQCLWSSCDALTATRICVDSSIKSAGGKSVDMSRLASDRGLLLS